MPGAFAGLPGCYGNRGFCLYILRAAASSAGPARAAQLRLREGNADLTQSRRGLLGFCGLRSLCFLVLVGFFCGVGFLEREISSQGHVCYLGDTKSY